MKKENVAEIIQTVPKKALAEAKIVASEIPDGSSPPGYWHQRVWIRYPIKILWFKLFRKKTLYYEDFVPGEDTTMEQVERWGNQILSLARK